jgi:hypothetical protein
MCDSYLCWILRNVYADEASQPMDAAAIPAVQASPFSDVDNFRK